MKEQDFSRTRLFKNRGEVEGRRTDYPQESSSLYILHILHTLHSPPIHPYRTATATSTFTFSLPLLDLPAPPYIKNQTHTLKERRSTHPLTYRATTLHGNKELPVFQHPHHSHALIHSSLHLL